MRRAVLLLTLAGCAAPCPEDEPASLRFACEEVTIPLVIHMRPQSPCLGLCGPEADALSGMITYANEVLEPHHLELEVDEEIVEQFTPFINETDVCPALDNLTDHAPRDGRLHIYVVAAIRKDDLTYGGYANEGVLVIDSNAKESIVAHEAAHTLGLRHRDDPNNIMNPSYPTSDATFDAMQGAKMLARACEKYGPRPPSRDQ